MRAAIKTLLERPDVVAQVVDELAKAVCTVLSLSRVDLIPEIPGEQRATPAPALDRK
jgi:hypothetical protein